MYSDLVGMINELNKLVWEKRINAAYELIKNDDHHLNNHYTRNNGEKISYSFLSIAVLEREKDIVKALLANEKLLFNKNGFPFHRFIKENYSDNEIKEEDIEILDILYDHLLSNETSLSPDDVKKITSKLKLLKKDSKDKYNKIIDKSHKVHEHQRTIKREKDNYKSPLSSSKESLSHVDKVIENSLISRSI